MPIELVSDCPIVDSPQIDRQTDDRIMSSASRKKRNAKGQCSIYERTTYSAITIARPPLFHLRVAMHGGGAAFCPGPLSVVSFTCVFMHPFKPLPDARTVAAVLCPAMAACACIARDCYCVQAAVAVVSGGMPCQASMSPHIYVHIDACFLRRWHRLGPSTALILLRADNRPLACASYPTKHSPSPFFFWSLLLCVFYTLRPERP